MLFRLTPRFVALMCCLGVLVTSAACGQRPAATSADRLKLTAETGLEAAERNTDIPLAEGDYTWPRLLGEDFDGTAASGDLTFDWTRPPETAWTLAVGSGYGLGSVADERYYQLDATFDDGVSSERLRAIDLANGEVLWSVKRPFDYRDLYGYESGPRATPTIAGDKIVSYGADGVLVCRSRADGKMIWSVDANEKYGVVQNFFGVGASPLILDDLVIISVGGSPPEDQSLPPGRLDRVIPNGSALVAFDLTDGTERWRSGDDLASYSSPRTIVLGDRTIVLLFARDHLLAVDPANGKVLWKHHHRADILESVNAMIPIVDGDRVFISECYQIGSVLLQADTDQAELIWQDDPNNRRVQSMRCHWSTPVLLDGFLYGCSGRNAPDSDFRCVEFATGKVQWEDGRRIRSSVALAGDHLVVLEERGMLQIVRPNPNELEVIAEYDLSDQIRYPCWAAPMIVGNRMLIRGDETVLCLALPLRKANKNQ